ncbi:hypothetical protein K458DRAFT_382488 [Lentithecium fluviatile CBS 122367]|uniref:Ubiquitin 3 binding protein But2 C-terminal domain-containing protein n=1 Tax=Lentithecium fluviatile CBS 122367 TaxID=1168545 RepID=A0A6G1JK16_9PLEO|nr:hypothetical protein K458DRAFT_382488 [Lentithecium fluviatile CBS 122367]
MLVRRLKTSLLTLFTLLYTISAIPHMSKFNILEKKTTYYPECRSISRTSMPLWVGTSTSVSPIGKSIKIALTADQQNFIVTYPQADAMLYTSAQVLVTRTKPTNPHPSSFPFSTRNGACVTSSTAETVTCTIPLIGSLLNADGYPVDRRTPSGCASLCDGSRWIYFVAAAEVNLYRDGQEIPQLAWAIDDIDADYQCIELLYTGQCVLQARWWQGYLYCD